MTFLRAFIAASTLCLSTMSFADAEKCKEHWQKVENFYKSNPKNTLAALLEVNLFLDDNCPRDNIKNQRISQLNVESFLTNLEVFASSISKDANMTGTYAHTTPECALLDHQNTIDSFKEVFVDYKSMAIFADLNQTDIDAYTKRLETVENKFLSVRNDVRTQCVMPIQEFLQHYNVSTKTSNTTTPVNEDLKTKINEVVDNAVQETKDALSSAVDFTGALDALNKKLADSATIGQLAQSRCGDVAGGFKCGGAMGKIIQNEYKAQITLLKELQKAFDDAH